MRTNRKKQQNKSQRKIKTKNPIVSKKNLCHSKVYIYVNVEPLNGKSSIDDHTNHRINGVHILIVNNHYTKTAIINAILANRSDNKKKTATTQPIL